jgi:hypothetical protein
MAIPTLTPTSQTSAIILPSTGTTGDVAAACPIGVYSGADFLSGAAKQVDYTYKKLGGDVLDIELKADNVYANYEEACLEYSYLVNIHQSKNALGSALGGTTGSFAHTGEFSGSASGSAGNDQANVKFPKMRFEMAQRVADYASNMAGIGGTEPIYSASFDSVSDQQDYDLQSIISASAVNSDNSAFPYYNKIKDKRILVRQVFFRTPNQMWRFYGYYGGLNVVGDMHSYGQYADDSSFNVIPAWQNKLQAIQYEDHLYTRTSHYSYEVIDNKLRLFPTPQSASPEKFWVKFSVKTDAFEDDGNNEDGLNGVNNMSNLPFENVPYKSINSIGKQWIRRFALALSKETLGQIRGKFGGAVPIPGDNVTLNASELLAQAKDEQTTLRDELKTILDEMTYDKLIEKEATMSDNTTKVQDKTPLPVFVG